MHWMIRHHFPRIVTPLILTWLVTGIAGCSWLSTPKPAAPEGSNAATEATAEEKAKDPFSAGLLGAIAETAPEGSPSRLLARIAAEKGWESQVAQNVRLKKAIEDEAFEEQIESYLLGLYYNNGFSVLPVVGEGHQFSRDTLVRGAVSNTRLLVTNRKLVNILFLGPVQNVQLVYHQDGEQPKVITLDPKAIITIRQSLLEQYLR